MAVLLRKMGNFKVDIKFTESQANDVFPFLKILTDDVQEYLSDLKSVQEKSENVS